MDPWEKQAGESAVWFQRFDRFRLMKPIRKVSLVFQQEEKARIAKTEQNRAKQSKIREKPPGVWYEIAKDWRWEERAAAWDKHIDRQLDQEIAAERKRVLRTELALQHKRIELLNRKALQLAEITDDESGIWIPDVKSVGFGPDAKRVDLVQFNDAAFRELREYLTDIADEMGERVKLTKQEVTGRDGAPLPMSTANVTFWIPDNGRDGYAGRRVQADEEGEGEDARQEGAGG